MTLGKSIKIPGAPEPLLDSTAKLSAFIRIKAPVFNATISLWVQQRAALEVEA